MLIWDLIWDSHQKPRVSPMSCVRNPTVFYYLASLETEPRYHGGLDRPFVKHGKPLVVASKSLKRTMLEKLGGPCSNRILKVENLWVQFGNPTNKPPKAYGTTAKEASYGKACAVSCSSPESSHGFSALHRRLFCCLQPTQRWLLYSTNEPCQHEPRTAKSCGFGI